MFKKNIDNNSNKLFIILNSMYLLLKDNQIKEFNKDIKKEFNKLSMQLKNVNISKVLDKMGFPADYLK